MLLMDIFFAIYRQECPTILDLLIFPLAVELYRWLIRGVAFLLPLWIRNSRILSFLLSFIL